MSTNIELLVELACKQTFRPEYGSGGATTPSNVNNDIKCLQYVDYYGGSVPAASKGKTERDLLEEEFQFLRDDEGDAGGSNDTGKEIAKKYYDNLFREFALIDLSRWREGQVALRWRTKQEVLQGLGQFTCASLTCPGHLPSTEDSAEFSLDAVERDVNEGTVNLETFEMNFGYVEKGVKKNALVKVCVCDKCAGKLRKVKGGSKDEEKRRDMSKDRTRRNKSGERRRDDSRDRRHRRPRDDGRDDSDSRSRRRRHEDERESRREPKDSEDKKRDSRRSDKRRHDEKEDKRHHSSRYSRRSRSRSPRRKTEE
ncbi:hypothetical protein H072_1874 [Dactylellina haptotyla CBS 200.50]|uniref:Protein FRA10AC1 n=1 Tax=Dactylellina haptotyla (strain CBS 200.50) TaxID=1284197 RepID=S8AT55_DACHA|nr:hypothetical protein H072_1874 [Dactylellina haptotyla CBS 200.50]